MATLGDLKQRIADEVHRTDLEDQISKAIVSAISFYSVEGYFFAEERITSTTKADYEWYALPSDFILLYTLRMTVNESNDYLLTQRTDQYMEAHYTPASLYQGYPTDFALFDQQIRLGPIPNDAYAMTMHYIKVLSDLGTDADSSGFTQSIGEQLIRSRAKWDLYTNLVHDHSNGQIQKSIELEAERQLTRQTTKQQSTGRFAAHL